MSKTIKISLYILLSVVMLVMAIEWLFSSYFEKKIVDSAKKQLAELSEGKYALVMDDVNLNLITGSLNIENLLISPFKVTDSINTSYLIKAESVKITGLSIISYWKNNDLIIDQMKLENAQISIFQGSGAKTQNNNRINNPFSAESSSPKAINSIAINQIDIFNSKFNMFHGGNDSVSFFSAQDNNLSIKKFKINKDTEKEKKLFEAEKIEIVMNQFFCHLNNDYSLHGKALKTTYNDSLIVIDSLQIIPDFTIKEYIQAQGEKISRVKVITSKALCKKMDFKSFFEFNEISIHKIDLPDCTIDIYRDNSLPLKQVKRPSLQALLKSFPFFIEVDTIHLENGQVYYEELNPGQAATDKISVKDINVTVTGVQNDSTQFSKNSSIKAVFKSLYMGKGELSETYIFPLDSTDEFFYCSGSLGAMPLSVFNPMVKNSKHLVFKNGQLDSANFEFVAGGSSSHGTMKFLYHDCVVEVLKGPGDKIGLIKGVKTFIANEFIIRDSNPEKGIVRVSTIYADRNPYRYFINYSLQSMLSGIANAIQDQKNAKLLSKKR
jgi:hypothetical protein